MLSLGHQSHQVYVYYVHYSLKVLNTYYIYNYLSYRSHRNQRHHAGNILYSMWNSDHMLFDILGYIYVYHPNMHKQICKVNN